MGELVLRAAAATLKSPPQHTGGNAQELHPWRYPHDLQAAQLVREAPLGSWTGQSLLLQCWGHRGPCTHREAQRKPGMLITLWCLLNGGDQIKCQHSIQKAGRGGS